MQFQPEPAAAGRARRATVKALARWGLDRFSDDAALCAAELATNAILHCRSRFTLAVRPIPSGVRIDIQDDRPDRLPVRLSVEADPLASGTTGRGLTLVASLCTRWGYFTTERAKTVWAELTDDRGDGVREAIAEVTAQPPARTARVVRLLGMPVLAAIASGVQIDDLVRELQLQPERLGAADRAVFYRLLERSARPRLLGRQEAFRAAGEGATAYDLDLTVSTEELLAVGELVDFLDRLAGAARLSAGQVAPEVDRMRSWVRSEVSAQYEGRAPTPFGATVAPRAPGGVAAGLVTPPGSDGAPANMPA